MSNSEEKKIISGAGKVGINRSYGGDYKLHGTNIDHNSTISLMISSTDELGMRGQ